VGHGGGGCFDACGGGNGGDCGVKFVIAKCTPLNPPYQGDREYSLTIFILINADNKPVAKSHTSGWWGMPTRNEVCLPFILLTDGRTDFGEYDNDSERFGETDILEQERIDLDTRFLFVVDAEEYDYKISEITILCRG
jgi:hypothetical protein